MENTAKPRSRHQGKKVRKMRELLNFTQEEVAEKMSVSQQTISNIEQSEALDDEQLKKVAEAFGVNVDAIKNLDEEATVYNIVTNNSNNEHVSGMNYSCTFNPLDKWAESIRENKKLYEALLKEKEALLKEKEALLKSEREKVTMLQRMLEERK